jgi:hypothetical protein
MIAAPLAGATIVSQLCNVNRCPACGAGVGKGGK